MCDRQPGERLTTQNGRSIQSVSNRQLLLPTLLQALRVVWRKRREFRYHVVRDLWSATKRLASAGVINVDVRDVPLLQEVVIDGFVDDRNRSVIAALCRGVDARTFFEIGTNRGRTAWTVAHNNPETTVFTLDLPSPDAAIAFDLHDSDVALLEGWAHAEAFSNTPEATRITPLFGDSATFDFSRFEQAIDVVYIDGAHSYSYVRNDTLVAQRIVRSDGLIIWDDYPEFPGVYRAINELSPMLGGTTFHILGTRLVVHSHRQLLAAISNTYGQRFAVA